jgi:hypothetical protein
MSIQSVSYLAGHLDMASLKCPFELWQNNLYYDSILCNMIRTNTFM